MVVSHKLLFNLVFLPNFFMSQFPKNLKSRRNDIISSKKFAAQSYLEAKHSMFACTPALSRYKIEIFRMFEFFLCELFWNF